MKDSEIFILSDTHINLLPSEKRTGLFTFLREKVARKAKALYLNGDIIDLMANSTADQTLESLHEFDDLIQEFSKRQVEVHYILGNHDLPLLLLFPGFSKNIFGFVDVHSEQQPWQINSNLTFHYRSMRFQFGQKHGYLEHGHIYDVGWVPGEKWIRAWEKASRLKLGSNWLENTLAIWEIFHGSGEDYEARILRTASHLPAPIYASREGTRIAHQNGFDLVILSHFHSPCLEELGGDRKFANPGDSLQHGNYLAIAGEEVRLGDWRETIA